MKKSVLLYFAFFIFNGVNAQQKEILAESKVTKVTVFLNNAEVTRTGKASLNAGSNLVVFERLPYDIIPGSVQVEGSEQFTIVSVNSSANYLQEGSERPEVKVMKKELDRVSDEINLNNSSLYVYNEQMNLLIANHTFKAENKGLRVDDMLAMTELYRNKLWQIQEKVYECEVKAKRMNAEYARISKQVKTLETKFNRYTTNVYLNLSASSKVNADIQISYIVRNAGWEANYDAKAKDLNSPLEITFKAAVHQTTGEDWKDVKLKLSTGNPLKSKTKPELVMWNLYAYDEQVYKKGKRSNAYNAEGTFSSPREDAVSYDRPADLEEIVVDEKVSSKKEKEQVAVFSTLTTSNFTSVAQTGITAEYNISIPYSIYSDGKSYTVEIKKENLPAEYSYYAVPKLDKDAFLVAKLTNWGKYNFIAGYMNVFIKDTYTGRSYFDAQSVEDTISISMGRDQSIVVQRKKQHEMCKTTVIGGNKKHNTVYEITIKNTRNTVVKIDLLDQIPVSPYKEVEVSVEEISGAQYNKEDGKLEWELEIAPGESKKVILNYSIKYPKDKFISNLEG